jgi:putative membrane protein
MKVTLMALTGLLAVASFCACNNNDDTDNMNGMVNATDSAFVLNAGLSNNAEISAAQLALTKSTDSIILHFAQMMADDHTAAQASLKAIAGKYNLTVPDTADAMHQQLTAELALMSGRAFDSMYIHQQVTDHQAAVQLYQNEENGGNNTDLKNFADTTLPKLQMHLDSANAIVTNY